MQTRNTMDGMKRSEKPVRCNAHVFPDVLVLQFARWRNRPSLRPNGYETTGPSNPACVLIGNSEHHHLLRARCLLLHWGVLASSATLNVTGGKRQVIPQRQAVHPELGGTMRLQSEDGQIGVRLKGEWRRRRGACRSRRRHEQDREGRGW